MRPQRPERCEVQVVGGADQGAHLDGVGDFRVSFQALDHAGLEISVDMDGDDWFTLVLVC